MATYHIHTAAAVAYTIYCTEKEARAGQNTRSFLIPYRSCYFYCKTIIYYAFVSQLKFTRFISPPTAAATVFCRPQQGEAHVCMYSAYPASNKLISDLKKVRVNVFLSAVLENEFVLDFIFSETGLGNSLQCRKSELEATGGHHNMEIIPAAQSVWVSSHSRVYQASIDFAAYSSQGNWTWNFRSKTTLWKNRVPSLTRRGLSVKHGFLFRVWEGSADFKPV